MVKTPIGVCSPDVTILFEQSTSFENVVVEPLTRISYRFVNSVPPCPVLSQRFSRLRSGNVVFPFQTIANRTTVTHIGQQNTTHTHTSYTFPFTYSMPSLFVFNFSRVPRTCLSRSTVNANLVMGSDRSVYLPFACSILI